MVNDIALAESVFLGSGHVCSKNSNGLSYIILRSYIFGFEGESREKKSFLASCAQILFALGVEQLDSLSISSN